MPALTWLGDRPQPLRSILLHTLWGMVAAIAVGSDLVLGVGLVGIGARIAPSQVAQLPLLPSQCLALSPTKSRKCDEKLKNLAVQGGAAGWTT
jgi:hypothetical protein